MILVPRQSFSLTASRRRFAPLSVPLAPQTTSIILTLRRPTTISPLGWGSLDRLRPRIVIERDGEFYISEGQATGGIRTTLRGAEVTEYRLVYGLQRGYFGAREGLPRRLGELTRTKYMAHVEIDRLDGNIETDILVESIEAPVPAVPFHSSVAFDAATSAVENAGDGILSISHTSAAGNPGVFAANASIDASPPLSTSITYGGTGMTEMWDAQVPAISAGNAGYRLAGQSTGAQTVTSTLAAGTLEHYLGVISMTGVDQATPVGTSNTANGTDTAATVTVASVAAGDLVVDNIIFGAGAETVGADQTKRNGQVGGSGGEMAQSTQPGTAGGVMSWTTPVNNWLIGAVAFKPAQDKMRWPIGAGVGGPGGTNLRPGMIG